MYEVIRRRLSPLPQVERHLYTVEPQNLPFDIGRLQDVQQEIDDMTRVVWEHETRHTRYLLHASAVVPCPEWRVVLRAVR